MNEKDTIKDFIKDIRSGNAVSALKNLRTVVEQKQHNRADKLVGELYETKADLVARIDEEHTAKVKDMLTVLDEDRAEKLQHIVDMIDEDHAIKMQAVIDKIDAEHAEKLQEVIDKLKADYEKKLQEAITELQEKDK